MGLRIINHLQPMLHLTMKPVMIGQISSNISLHPTCGNKPLQTFLCATHPQRRITPPRDQLPGLCKELNLANATAPQFHVVPF